mgnify:CR=1 FL=1
MHLAKHMNSKRLNADSSCVLRAMRGNGLDLGAGSVLEWGCGPADASVAWRADGIFTDLDENQNPKRNPADPSRD